VFGKILHERLNGFEFFDNLLCLAGFAAKNVSDHEHNAPPEYLRFGLINSATILFHSSAGVKAAVYDL
jgi:hypothetical protein